MCSMSRNGCFQEMNFGVQRLIAQKRGNYFRMHAHDRVVCTFLPATRPITVVRHSYRSVIHEVYSSMMPYGVMTPLYGGFNTRRYTIVHGFCFFKLFPMGFKELINGLER